MKNIIFISHANPQDNEFTLWLASRLRLMGYQVWCDIEGLIGGEKTWDEIDNIIRNKTIKFLLVVSEHTCTTPGKVRESIANEFRLAESLAKDIEGDFVIPLKVDDVPYNYFIGLNTYNNISFFKNWANGLKKLVEKLEKDNIPKENKPDNKAFATWYENEYMTKYGIIEKKETYFTNWWEVKSLPEYLHIFQYENDSQAKTVYINNKKYPGVRNGAYVISFEEELVEPKNDSTFGEFTITYKRKHRIKTEDILEGNYSKNTYPTLLDCENLLKWLLNESFSYMMKEKFLSWSEMSNRKRVYYFPRTYKEKITFKYKGKKKTKNLNGRYQTTNFWHAAISARAQLSPILGYSLKTHLLFSDDGERVWENVQHLHSARRKKGKRWFNEEWRDILFAFINALKDENEKIEMDLSSNFTLELADITYFFTSNRGYNEPHKDRLTIMQEEEYDENIEDNEETK